MKLFFKRCLELYALKDGWYDENSLAPNHNDLNLFLQMFVENYLNTNLTLPYVYPNNPKGIRFDWDFIPEDISLDIDLETKFAHYHNYNHHTGNVIEMNYDFNKKLHWEMLIEEIACCERGHKCHTK